MDAVFQAISSCILVVTFCDAMYSLFIKLFILFSDVPPLEDMSELLKQVDSIRQNDGQQSTQESTIKEPPLDPSMNTVKPQRLQVNITKQKQTKPNQKTIW